MLVETTPLRALVGFGLRSRGFGFSASGPAPYLGPHLGAMSGRGRSRGAITRAEA